MRTLCLNLQTYETPSIAEGFLNFSPKIQFRKPGYLFADVTDTATLFGGEKQIASEALAYSKQFYPDATVTIADSPWTAQALSEKNNLHIVSPAEDHQEISTLPLNALKKLEGLIAWESLSEVEDIIHFFQLLGLERIGEIQKFQAEAFRERWGTTGSTLWRRLHGLDRQVISPLLPKEALSEYIYLDFPISLLPFLTHSVEKKMVRIFQRLQGRREFASKLRLHLFCEYSNCCHVIEVQPTSPSREGELFLKLIENKLVELDLSNPIREFEIEAITCQECTQPLDLWGPQTETKTKLKKVTNIFNQANIATGFFQPTNSISPEGSGSTTNDYQAAIEQPDTLDICGTSLQVKTSHSHNLSNAPRPSRVLEKPLKLSDAQILDLHFLSDHPIDRSEDNWWQESRGRDYYIALNVVQQLIWIFYDHIEQEYFIHGYFD